MSIEVTVPALGESIVEATVGRWLKQQGEAISAGEPLVELETDKVNMEVVAPDDGTLTAIARQEGDTVAIGDVLATMESGSSGASDRQPRQSATSPVPSEPQSAVTASPEAGAQPPPPSTPTPPDDDGQGSRSTPLARRVAAEHGIDIGQVSGTGPSGRVTKEDVSAYLQRTPTAEAVASSSIAAPNNSAGSRPEERVRMTRRRLTIARRLVEAQQTAAMLTTFNEVDMTAIMAIRKQRRDAFRARYSVNLGYMSFFTKAVVAALKIQPRLNAEIQNDEILFKHYYDIGIAVGMEEGLVVPVVRNADQRTFAEIEREIGVLAEKARGGQLSLAELQGGTFTISNGGIYGSLLSTPILNAPQVGILGMHKIQERPIALNGEVVIRPMMYLALSYDHRIVDGSEAVRFLVHVKEMLEDPTLLLLEI